MVSDRYGIRGDCGVLGIGVRLMLPESAAPACPGPDPRPRLRCCAQPELALSGDRRVHPDSIAGVEWLSLPDGSRLAVHITRAPVTPSGGRDPADPILWKHLYEPHCQIRCHRSTLTASPSFSAARLNHDFVDALPSNVGGGFRLSNASTALPRRRMCNVSRLRSTPALPDDGVVCGLPSLLADTCPLLIPLLGARPAPGRSAAPGPRSPHPPSAPEVVRS
jgi:hypothetical protein